MQKANVVIIWQNKIKTLNTIKKIATWFICATGPKLRNADF